MTFDEKVNILDIELDGFFCRLDAVYKDEGMSREETLRFLNPIYQSFKQRLNNYEELDCHEHD